MTHNLPDQQLDRDRELDRVVFGFDQALRRGDLVRIEDLVAEENSLGPRLLTELLWTEIEFRQARRELIDWEGYAVRFPQEGDALRRAQAAASSAMASETSQRSAHDSVSDADEPQDAIAEPLAPLDLGDYLLGELLGGGGQGDVYLARQRSLARPVAV